MRWNLKKPRTGLNLSYHFHWSSQMLAILLWIAKPVWQRCLPFSKLPFFSKKVPKNRCFCALFQQTTKKTRQIVKRLFLAPKERSFNLQSPHPGLFSCVFPSKNNSSWIILEVKYLAIYIVILLCWQKNEVCPSLQVSKKVYIFWNFFV